LNADGVASGRRVREGETIGRVGNYNRRSNGTTYHLHFETWVPTRDGWVRVNPYQTLVAAYEHLIRARGIEIAPANEEPADLSATSEATSSKAGKSKASKSKKKKPRHKPRKKRGR
jgi:murein DD-endopeptidase MepM/ murein hydrolase activator NlpD